jgi:hypothetical protein
VSCARLARRATPHSLCGRLADDGGDVTDQEYTDLESDPMIIRVAVLAT